MNRLKLEVTQALRNLLRNQRRTLITGLAILSGFVGLNLLSGYVARVERYFMVSTVYLNHNGHVQIYKKDGIDKYFSKPKRYLLSSDELNQIHGLLKNYHADVEASYPYILGNGLLQYEKKSFPFQGKGVTPDSDRFTRQHPLVKEWTNELNHKLNGVPFSDERAPANPLKITFKLSEALGNQKQLNLQGLTLDNGFNALDTEVAALYSTGLDLTEDTSLMTTVDVLRDLMATDGTTYLGVYLKNDLQTRWVTKKLNEDFKNASLPYEAYPFYDERIGLFYTGTMNFLYAMASFFFSLVSLVVILSMANAISMNIIERIRELGTMRAMGFTPHDISRMIAWESFFLAILSIGSGYLITQAIAFAVNTTNIRFFPPGIAGDMQFILTPWTSICFILAIPLVTFAVITARIVANRKLQGEVASLLIETTT